MSKKGRHRRKQQRQPQRRNSPLSSHKQVGKTLTPPMMTLPNVRAVNWERDALPDYLLMAAFLEGKTARDTHLLLRLLTAIDKAREQARDDRAPDPADVTAEPPAENSIGEQGDTGDRQAHASTVFTGRLTQFEDFTPSERDAVLNALIGMGVYDELVPEKVYHFLGMYPDAPGAWLLQPWRDRGTAVDPAAAERALGIVLRAAGPPQGPVATRTKILVCNRWAQAGLVHLSAQTTHLAQEFNEWPHPHDDSPENQKTEAAYRAMYGALESMTAGTGDTVLAWAKSFWRSNWHIYRCHWPDDPSPSAAEAAHKAPDDAQATHDGEPQVDDDVVESAGEGAARVSYWRHALDEARAAIDEIDSGFRTLVERTDPDLYDPDRHEVLTGIVGRTLRYLTVFVGYPPLWTMEHGAPVLRALVEARIVLRFLASRADAALYAQFKEYGRGKLKLLKLHLEDVIDEQAEPSPDLVDYVEYLDALVNQDLFEEFQEIDVRGNFAGVDTRRMATEVGLEREYRLLFSPASSNVHGEWSIIDEYVFDRCVQPAHRRHRILRHDREHRTGPMFLTSLLDHAQMLVTEYETATAAQRTDE